MDCFLGKKVFGPLGMKHTCFNPPYDLRDRAAATEYCKWRRRVMVGEVHDENAWAMGGVSGNAGLFSIVQDLAVFARMILHKGTFDGVSIFSPQAVETMTRDHTGARLNENRGLGWLIRGNGVKSSSGDLMSPKAFGHTGFTGTSIWIDPELDIFVFSLLTEYLGRDNNAHIRLRPRFHNAVVSLFCNRKVVGLMSGTSVDGVDAAVVELSGHAESTELGRVFFEKIPYSPELRAKVLDLMIPETSRVDDICRMNFILGEVFADAALQAIKAAGLKTDDIDLIGSHGQTIYHIPNAETCCGITTRSTLQIGEPAVIAERTGITTVADFRMRDIAAGGQGAPLVPYADYILLRDAEKSRVIQNIGGIGNLTLLPAGCSLDEVIAFDTGPGNMVIDAVVSIVTDGEMGFDEDGKIAASGNVEQGLLDWLLSHPYFRKAPRKLQAVRNWSSLCKRYSREGPNGGNKRLRSGNDCD